MMKKKKLRVSFEMEIDVTFHDEEKAKAYFIDGDWKKYFWRYDDLEEASEKLAAHFHAENDTWQGEGDNRCMCRFIEGWGLFLDKESNNVYTLCPEGENLCGPITIRYEMELEPMGNFEI